jgi:hypothetical protein
VARADRHSTIFVQRGGRKLREAGYSLDSDRYVAPNINVWQRHILKGGAVSSRSRASPRSCCGGARRRPARASSRTCPSRRTAASRGSPRRRRGLSACVIPSEDGKDDELWALVERDGDGYKSVEQQAPPWEEGETALADAFYVDSGATYSGAPTTTVSGLDHLAGRAVAVLADGAVVPGAASTAAAI